MDNTRGQPNNTDQQSSLQRIWDVGASSSAMSSNPTNTFVPSRPIVHQTRQDQRYSPYTFPSSISTDSSPRLVLQQIRRDQLFMPNSSPMPVETLLGIYSSQQHVGVDGSHSIMSTNQLFVAQPRPNSSSSINYQDANQPSTSTNVQGSHTLPYLPPQPIHANGGTASNIISNQSGAIQTIQNSPSNYPNMNQRSMSQNVPVQQTMSDYASQPIHVRGGTVPEITSNQSVVTQPIQILSPSINYPDPNQPSTSRYELRSRDKGKEPKEVKKHKERKKRKKKAGVDGKGNQVLEQSATLGNPHQTKVMKVPGQHTMIDYAPQPIHVRGGTVPYITSNQSVFQPMQTFTPSINYPDPNQPSTSIYVPGPSAMIHNASQLIHTDGRTNSNITSNQIVITQPIQNASSINNLDMNQPSTSGNVPGPSTMIVYPPQPNHAEGRTALNISSIQNIVTQPEQNVPPSIIDQNASQPSTSKNDPAAPKDCVLCPHCGSMSEDSEFCPKCTKAFSFARSPKPKTEIEIDTKEHIRTLTRNLTRMRAKKEQCDLIIQVGSKEIFAHKFILSAGSSYFDEMLSKITEVVKITELEPNCVEKCIDFIYTGIPPKLDDDIEPLMPAACLVAPKLFNQFAKILDETLSLENFTTTWKLATSNDIKRLEEKCENFVRVNFKKILQTGSFVHMDKKFMKKYLQLKITEFREESKLNALLRWVKFAPETREKFMDEMLEFISVSKIHVRYLRHLIENESLIKSNASRIQMLSLCVMNKIAPKSMSYEELECENYQIMIFDEESGYLQKFNPADNSIERMQKFKKAMVYGCYSAVCVGDYIYVLMENKSVHRLLYSNKEATWEQMQSFIDDHRFWPPAVTFNNCIYIIGSYTKSVEKYDTQLNVWIKLPDKLHALDGSSLVVFNDQIHCCGGYSEEERKITNAVERFDPVDLTWTTVAPMKEARYQVSAISFDGKLYILGGLNEDYDELTTVECYDGNAWTTFKPMTVARWDFQSFEINGDIYAVGGDYLSIEKYSFDKDEWQVITVPDIGIRKSVKIRI